MNCEFTIVNWLVSVDYELITSSVSSIGKLIIWTKQLLRLQKQLCRVAGPFSLFSPFDSRFSLRSKKFKGLFPWKEVKIQVKSNQIVISYMWILGYLIANLTFLTWRGFSHRRTDNISYRPQDLTTHCP